MGGVEYQIEAFQRDKETSLAPEALKAIHPLGKSPVIKDDDLVIAESGAMTEYLIDKYAADRLAPQRGTPEYVEYLQWLHFAESSAMVPLLLKMFLKKDVCKTNFLEAYADGGALKILTYLSEQLDGKDYLVGNQLSGADIMVFFCGGYGGAIRWSGIFPGFGCLFEAPQNARSLSKS